MTRGVSLKPSVTVMTNPNDRWRHQQSAAPHAPQHSPLTPGLPLQPGQPAMNIGGGDDAFPVSDRSGDPTAINVWLMIAGAFIVAVFSGPIFGSLYPLATGTAAAAYFAMDGMLHSIMPRLDDSSRLPFVGGATLVVFWFMSRLDHRLAATIPPYRLVRHVARVVLIAILLTLNTIGLPGRNGWMPRSLFEVRLVLADRRFLPVMAVAAVIAHLFLTRAKGMRARWDRGLEFVRLRPKSLSSGAL